MQRNIKRLTTIILTPTPIFVFLETEDEAGDEENQEDSGHLHGGLSRVGEEEEDIQPWPEELNGSFEDVVGGLVWTGDSGPGMGLLEVPT